MAKLLTIQQINPAHFQGHKPDISSRCVLKRYRILKGIGQSSALNTFGLDFKYIAPLRSGSDSKATVIDNRGQIFELYTAVQINQKCAIF